MTESGVNYRCIRLNEHDRAKAVLSAALEKHALDQEDPSRWKLCQRLPGRELSLPDNANVFFGLDQSGAKEGTMIEFILRRKTSDEIREMEREIRQRKNKIYEAQGVTLKGITSLDTEEKSANLARQQSLAQAKFTQDSLKSKSTLSMNPTPR